MTGVLAYCRRGYHQLCSGTRCACPCHRNRPDPIGWIGYRPTRIGYLWQARSDPNGLTFVDGWAPTRKWAIRAARRAWRRYLAPRPAPQWITPGDSDG